VVWGAPVTYTPSIFLREATQRAGEPVEMPSNGSTFALTITPWGPVLRWMRPDLIRRRMGGNESGQGNAIQH
jgi:hypothetical protein